MSAHDDDDDYDEEEKETSTKPPASKSKPLLPKRGARATATTSCSNACSRYFGFCSKPSCPKLSCFDRMLRDGLPMQMGLRPRPARIEWQDAELARLTETVEERTRPDDVLRLTVLDAEALVDELHVVHPIVRVHVVDATTGAYIKRRSVASGHDAREKGAGTGATTWFEGRSAFAAHGIGQQGFKIDRQCDYVLPVASQPAPLPSQSLSAAWNEPIDVHTSYASLLDPNVLFLFEIVDFGPNISVKDARKRNGVSAIAWAFLRPVSSDGQINVALRSGRHRRRARDVAGDDGDHPSSSEDDDAAPLARGTGDQVALSRPLRLQLYKFKPLSALARKQAHLWAIDSPPPPVTSNVPAVFVQFLQWRRERYPSTLAVKLAPVRCPRVQDVYHPRRPRVPNEREKHREAAQIGGGLRATPAALDAPTTAPLENSAEVAYRAKLRRRMRQHNEPCLLPDRLLDRVTAGKHGAMTVRFSNRGDLLAIACCEDITFPIRLYHLESPEGAVLLCELDGHHSVVYELCWSADDRFLVSASADGTAKVWCVPWNKGSHGEPDAADATSDAAGEAADGDDADPTSHSKAPHSAAMRTSPYAVLQHSPPCFVYSAAFVAAAGASEPARRRAPPHVVTGGFDGQVRFWDGQSGELLGMLENEDEAEGDARKRRASTAAPTGAERGPRRPHSQHVNAIVVGSSGKVYTADSAGVIAVWKRVGAGTKTQHFAYRSLRCDELLGKAITSMALHPTRRLPQLLVQAQQNFLRLFDLSTNRPIRAYTGSQCRLSMIRARFSPDGRYVVAGSEDGRVYVWEAFSNLRVAAALSIVSYPQPLCDVSWHPTQHVLALTCFGGESPTLIYYAERSGGHVLTSADSAAAGGGAARDEDDEKRKLARKQRLSELRAKQALRRELKDLV